MTAIDSLAAYTQTQAPATAAKAADRNTLGQDSFLKLLTAQLQNQNPLDPLDNNEFVGQMAQFSTVNGINQINATLGDMAAGRGSDGIAAMSSMIGRRVLVETPVTLADGAGAVAGRVTLDAPADAVEVVYSDPQTGAPIHTQSFGAQPMGALDFGWSDAAIAGRPVTVSVTASTAAGDLDLPASLYARVIGAAPGVAGGEPILDVEGYGQISALEIQSIR